MNQLDNTNKNFSRYGFLITGGAGFIGSNIAKYLVSEGAGLVRVLDDLSTGDIQNLEPLFGKPNFEFIKGNICDFNTCQTAIKGMHFISHHAALGSVQRSHDNPIHTNHINIDGFLNILYAAKDSESLLRLVYASSSSVYGDSDFMPKSEDIKGQNLLSAYAVSKFTNELYAGVFSRNYSLHTIGLRYFNVFGSSQKRDDVYGAVIPRFIFAGLENKRPLIFGDGNISRDFTYIENVVQANVLAFFMENQERHEVFNIASGKQTSLNDLWQLIRAELKITLEPEYKASRVGDIKHSLANISKAERFLGYKPQIDVEKGIRILTAQITNKVLN